MQYFHWYIPADGNLWKQVAKESKKLSDLGITALWLPPAYKGLAGAYSVGYDIYDLYDLGEFDQKGTIRTKYGTKDEFVQAIAEAKKHEIDIYGDIVFNHKAGADYKERVWAQKVDWNDRNIEYGDPRIIEAWTKFTFPGRIKFNERQEIIEHKYSDFIWDYLHFDGTDWDDKAKEKAIYKFDGHGEQWEKMLDNEKGNYDFLMFADIDFDNYEVRDEMKRWAKWFIETTGVNGFRLDAIKHIAVNYFVEWLDYLRNETGKELFTVGEYWNPHRLDILLRYLKETQFKMSLFDAPLQNKFHQASRNPEYDLREIFHGTLVSNFPTHAVTLVDNHDTQPLQALEAPVADWFKPLAYAIILLREQGYPCVFYPDLYGTEYTDKGGDGNTYKITLNPVKELPTLLKARKDLAYGRQIDYIDFHSTIGWTRLGDKDHQNAMAVVISNGTVEGFKDMYVGTLFDGKSFIDILGNRNEKVQIKTGGVGHFTVNPKSVSVWICEELNF